MRVSRGKLLQLTSFGWHFAVLLFTSSRTVPKRGMHCMQNSLTGLVLIHNFTQAYTCLISVVITTSKHRCEIHKSEESNIQINTVGIFSYGKH